MPGQHALLSPSAAHRWMNCPPAPRLETTVPDNETSYAQEGTLAHAYCARKLKCFLGLSTYAEDVEIAELDSSYHTGEMDEYTDTYATIVMEKFNTAITKTRDALLLVEKRLDFSDYIPEAFGTSDAMIIADGCMEIIDFKYGKGVKVSAERNPQMMIYALGAYLAQCFEYRIERVRMTIIQPRIDNLSEYEMTVSDLMEWAENELRPKAQAAYNGSTEQNPGEWCQFCKVKCSCNALANRCMTVVRENQTPALISPDEIARDILPWLPIIRAWCACVEDYTLQQALSGTTYSGYKLVEGRSVRKITDSSAVASLLEREGYDTSEYMKPATLCGISDLEKLVGKKRFAALCADYITKPQGKPTLVTDDDKRPVYNAASNDFNDININ